MYKRQIEKRRVAVGDMVDSIVIENDGMFTETTYESVEEMCIRDRSCPALQ